MGGIVGFCKKILVGTERDELSLTGSYKAMLNDALKMNQLLLQQNMEIREGTKTSVWDIAGQFLQMPPEAQGALIQQLPAILKGVFENRGKV